MDWNKNHKKPGGAFPLKNRILRRAAALLLALLLLPLSGLAAKFKPKDISEARSQALSAFRVCAFSAEYGDEGRNYIVRWDQPIRIWVDPSGKQTKNDKKELESFVMELGLRVPTLPPITFTGNSALANVKIYYCKYKDMGSRIKNYVSGNWGYFSYNYADRRIQEGAVAIATDKGNQQSRNHLIKEELVGVLGLSNDHEIYADSILYQKWTTVRDLSEVDWLMLNFLYSPLLKPGDTWSTCEQALRKFYDF